MIQQVNLYQKNDSDQQLLASPYIQGVLVFSSLLVLASIWVGTSWYGTHNELIQLQAQLEQAKNGLQQEQQLYPEQTIDSQLEQELTQTQSLYQSLAQTLEKLSDSQSDASLGFSKYLVALGNQVDGQVWITNLAVDSNANSISLQGRTFKPEQIPVLLERLKTTQAFKGRHFARLSVQEADGEAQQVDFTVSSSIQTETEDSDERNH